MACSYTYSSIPDTYSETSSALSAFQSGSGYAGLASSRGNSSTIDFICDFSSNKQSSSSPSVATVSIPIVAADFCF